MSRAHREIPDALREEVRFLDRRGDPRRIDRASLAHAGVDRVELPGVGAIDDLEVRRSLVLEERERERIGRRRRAVLDAEQDAFALPAHVEVVVAARGSSPEPRSAWPACAAEPFLRA